MPSKNQTKKLTLKRESLRDLTTGQMQQVAGGARTAVSCLLCPHKTTIPSGCAPGLTNIACQKLL